MYKYFKDRTPCRYVRDSRQPPNRGANPSPKSGSAYCIRPHMICVHFGISSCESTFQIIHDKTNWQKPGRTVFQTAAASQRLPPTTFPAPCSHTSPRETLLVPVQNAIDRGSVPYPGITPPLRICAIVPWCTVPCFGAEPICKIAEPNEPSAAKPRSPTNDTHKTQRTLRLTLPGNTDKTNRPGMCLGSGGRMPRVIKRTWCACAKIRKYVSECSRWLR